jgi:hypothetical protein
VSSSKRDTRNVRGIQNHTQILHRHALSFLGNDRSFPYNSFMTADIANQLQRNSQARY